MTGLLIKELIMRGLGERILVITPGGLTKQCQEDEMAIKFNIPSHWVSENEMNRLAQLGECAWLYIVADCKTGPALFRLQNPAKNLSFQLKSKGIQYFIPLA